jgi:hypothetical protein
MFLTPIHTIFYKKNKKKILIGFVIIPIKMYLFKPHLISNHSNTLKEVFFFKMNKNDDCQLFLRPTMYFTYLVFYVFIIY